MDDRVYHLELRAFPGVARIFNLDRETLDERYLRPHGRGESIEYDDRRWAAEKTRVSVWLAPPVPAAARGLGRGWGEVTRTGEEVTDAVLTRAGPAGAHAEVEALKDVLSETAAGAGLGFPDAVALAAAAHPGRRASQALGLAEQAIWEMLHQGRLELLDAELEPVAATRWQEIVLSWDTWAGDARPAVRLRAAAPGESGATQRRGRSGDEV